MTRRDAERRIRETFVQRFGRSVMPLVVTWDEAAKTATVLDPENGRRARYSYKGRRLFRQWDNEAEQPA